MTRVNSLRRRIGWLIHCYKAVFRNYHYQLLPLFPILIKPGDLVIDVGAHVGQLSKIFSRNTRAGLVLSLEPASYPYSILQIVKFLHKLSIVKTIKMGISVKQGEASLHTPVKSSGVVRFGLSQINNDGSDDNGNTVLKETISVTTIDKLTKQFAHDYTLSLIKADIEGYEYQMLCGAEHSIEQHKPSLLIEISVNRNEILEFLWQRDYLVFGLLNYSGKSHEKLELIRIADIDSKQIRNVLAVHSSKKDLLDSLYDNFPVHEEPSEAP
ncbi:MAG: FkbM family methyltransferase [Gammaproteobacteria bacterium]|nr:FkbM family methyltransferase [Gammaproteobacteria bacterium]